VSITPEGRDPEKVHDKPPFVRERGVKRARKKLAIEACSVTAFICSILMVHCSMTEAA
jgi:hypothetical protein